MRWQHATTQPPTATYTRTINAAARDPNSRTRPLAFAQLGVHRRIFHGRLTAQLSSLYDTTSRVGFVVDSRFIAKSTFAHRQAVGHTFTRYLFVLIDKLLTQICIYHPTSVSSSQRKYTSILAACRYLNSSATPHTITFGVPEKIVAFMRVRCECACGKHFLGRVVLFGFGCARTTLNLSVEIRK